MHSPTFVRPVALAIIIALLTLVAGCSKTADAGLPSTTPAAAAPQASANSPSKSPSKLGDLSAFRGTAADVATMVEKGNLPAAKARIKDLEVAWDSAEAGLKPRAADDWHVLDKAIDRALGALRADAPNQTDCKHAMTELLKTLDSLQGTTH
jgi:soluble cytochrome b562